MTIACSTLSLHDFPAAALPAWRELARRAEEPNPFLDPDVLLPAVGSFDNRRDVRLLVAADGDRWLACLPVRRQAGWRALALPCMVSWTGPHGFLSTPLLDRDALDEAADALLDRRGRIVPSAFLAIRELGDGGPVSAALRRAAEARGTSAIDYQLSERAALHRRETDDYIHVSSKRRREHGRTRRGLESELGSPAVTVDRGTDPSAVTRFLGLEKSGWKGREGSALASDEAGERFFRAACAGLAARRALHILELGADRPGAEPVASLCLFRAGDTLFAFKVAYDERLTRFAPGIHLLADAASWFHAETDAARIDSCASPDNRMINTLWPDKREICALVLPRRGALGLATRGGMQVVRTRRRRLMHA